MKKILLGALMVIAGFFAAPKVEAQAPGGNNINIGDQPRWRAPGYDYVEYYYLPDIETYYHVPGKQFIYMSDGRWVFSPSVPPRYKDYDLYSGNKVVVNRPNAYQYHEQDKARYSKKQDNGNHFGWYKNKKQKTRTN